MGTYIVSNLSATEIPNSHKNRNIMFFLSMTLFGSWHLPSPKQYGFEQKSLEPSLAMQLWLFICITMVMAPISWDIAHHIHYIPIYGVGKRNASNLFKKTCAFKKTSQNAWNMSDRP
jgi:hypothetical protein